MESLEVSIQHGGTADVPTWRIAVERTASPEHDLVLLGEWEGRGPDLRLSTLLAIVATVDGKVTTMLCSELRLFDDSLPINEADWVAEGWSVGPFDE